MQNFLAILKNNRNFFFEMTKNKNTMFLKNNNNYKKNLFFKVQISSFKSQNLKLQIFNLKFQIPSFKFWVSKLKSFTTKINQSFFDKNVKSKSRRNKWKSHISKTMEQQSPHHIKSNPKFWLFAGNSPDQSREALWLPFIKIEVEKSLHCHNSDSKVEKTFGYLSSRLR